VTVCATARTVSSFLPLCSLVPVGEGARVCVCLLCVCIVVVCVLLCVFGVRLCGGVAPYTDGVAPSMCLPVLSGWSVGCLWTRFGGGAGAHGGGAGVAGGHRWVPASLPVGARRRA
jgi:TRAP-type C4-dicarboxylate transport system permease small subunit